MKFSESYNLQRSQAELDFIDIDNTQDLPLFFDPYVFSNASDNFSLACANEIQSYFNSVIQLVAVGDREHALELLGRLNEPNEICLGFSRGAPHGRGVGALQAEQLYDRLANSAAAQSGELSDLEDCELFVDGFGPDKISDICANIIRGQLIEYTQAQCELHDVSGLRSVPMGPIWSRSNLNWGEDYYNLPTLDQTPVLLVPKRTVRWHGDLSHQHQKFYSHFVLNFLRDEHLQSGSHLVRVIRNEKKKTERRVVYKKDVEREHPLSKDFLFRFSQDNPAVLAKYKLAYKKTKALEVKDLSEDFDTAVFCDALVSSLRSIPAGTAHANAFHKLMIGALEFIFYPTLSYPKKEAPIHQGRKRIDIRFDNAATEGLFYRIHRNHGIPSGWIWVECKNYSSDPANPELDQLAMRFSPNRGRFGLLLARTFEDRALFIQRCRDAVADGHGWIIPLVDDDVVKMLRMIKEGRKSEVDHYISAIFAELT